MNTVERGNWRYAQFVFTASSIDPSAASTTVTFSLTEPDGSLTTVTSPNAAITGPTPGASGSLTTTTWVWKTPIFDQVGRHTIDCKSVGGIIAEHRIDLKVI